VSDYSWLDDLELTSLVQEAMEDERSTIFRSPVRRSRRYAPRTSRPRVSVEAYLLKAHREKVGQLLRDVVNLRLNDHPDWASRGFFHGRRQRTMTAHAGSLCRQQESWSLPSQVRETISNPQRLSRASLDHLSLQSLLVEPTPAARIQRGLVHVLTGQTQQALATYRDASNETASPILRTLALNNAADVLVTDGHLTEGLSLYERALAVNDSIPELHFGLLITSYRVGDRRRFARASSEVELRFTPSHPSVRRAKDRSRHKNAMAARSSLGCEPVLSGDKPVGETTAAILGLT
jgi:hypothetical protein